MELRVLRICGVVSIVSYCGWWFLPYTYEYMNQDIQSLLSYGNYGAILPESKPVLLFGLFILLATNIAAFGTMLCRKAFRSAYAILVFLSVVTVPLWGMSVETAGGAFLGYVASLSSGALLAVSYYSKASNAFH